MKRAIKITLITVAVLVVLILGTAIVIPFLFKDQVLTVIKETANKSLNAKMDFSDVSLSLLRSFPNLTVRLYDLTIDNIEPFDGIRLADVKSADITVDIMSIIRNENPVRIKAINVEQPRVNVYVLEDGRANYDIAKPSADTAAAAEPTDLSAFRANLQRYSITDADILYDDKTLGAYVSIKGLNHSGSGDFTVDVYDLDTDTEIDSLTISYGGIMYLKRAHATLDAIFNVDQKNSRYTLKENALKVNELEVNADGFVQLVDSANIAMDLTFSTPQNSFKNLLSMVPNAYIAGYENVKADGQFDLGGWVKGTYNGDLEQYPAFQINLGVENANVKYPDLPLGITNINTKVNVNSPSSNFDDMVVDIPNFAMKLGSNPIKAVFNLKTPISDPDIDTQVDGVLNLKELAQAFPMDGINDLSGVIAANIEAKTRLSYIENKEYDRVNMDGVAEVTNLVYRDAVYPAIRINHARAAFTPQSVRVDNFDAKLGKSDLKASGKIDNILAYFSPKKTMRGTFTVRSNYFNVNEWIPAEEAAGPTLPATDETATSEAPTEIFDRFDFTLNATLGKIVYDVYTLENTVVKGNMKPNKLVAQELSTNIGNSDIRASGVINNMFDYLFDNQTLSGEINLASNFLDLNQFMTEDGTAASAQSTATSTEVPSSNENLDPIVIPEKVNIDVNANLKKVRYTNLDLANVQGRLAVADQAVTLQDVTANTLGGKAGLSGGYDSKNPENPAFTMKIDLQSMDFQKSFNAFNTFQVLAPIGQFMKGTFNTSLIMDGKLGKDMMPDFTTLSAKGFLETLNAVIENFKPLQAIGNQFNLDYFKEEFKIANSKNWFEVKNGAVEVKDFDYKYKDIDMTIGGTHSIKQDMDYKIKAKIPRKLLEKTSIGATAGAALDQLSQEASKFGLNLKQSEFVNVQFNLTGNIKNPKVGMKFLGADGEIVAEESPVTEAKKALKKGAEAKIEEGKQVVKETAEKAVDSLKTVAGQKIEAAKDTLTKKAEEMLRGKAGSIIDTTAKKEVDKIKEELEKFNPLKKKKKNEGSN